jgi:type I restriction enzyme S subunit
VSFPAYPSYQDSGVNWLANVPSHWQVRRLGGVFSERREKVSDTEFPPLSVTKLGIVPQLETAAKTDDNDNRKGVRAGDFVINSRSDRKGSSGLSQLDGSVSLINTVITPDALLDPTFVHFLLRSVAFQEEFYRYGKGIVADLWSTNYSEMKNILLAFPERPEQAVIASFLDRETAKIDALIEEQRRLIALLKEKRQAVISHAVTKGLDPHAPLKDSGIDWLGKVPAHWDIVPLKFLASVQTGLAKGKDHGDTPTVRLPYLRVANVQNGHLNLEDVAEIDVLPSDVDRYRLRIGDVLMNEGGDFDKLGRGDIWRGQIAECLHQNHVFVVRPIKIAPSWLNLINGSDYAQRFFILRSKQTTNLASISSSNLMELPVVIPPPDEQSSIEEMVSAQRTKLDDLTGAADHAVDLLIERRSALISAAVTGKIDVRQSAKILPFPIDRARARRFVATEIIERLAHQPTFGRTKLQKVAYLAEAHANITELAGCYIRMPFGPLDQPMMDEIEATGSEDGIAIDDKRDGSMVRYRVTGTKGSHTADLRNWLGEERFTKLDHLIKVLSGLKTHSAEAIATLYAVWNDALIERRSLTDEQIFSAFFSWHPKKGENFRADELPHWLDWMRRHGIVPTGSGSKTVSQIGTLL